MNSLSSRLDPEAPAANQSSSRPSPVTRLLWLLIPCVLAVYLPLLVLELVVRGMFPWDFLNWPESPFMTDMMKLTNHQPVYTEPMDVNSFVYSPGLEYITFALLKPFGLALDIRFCRLINDLIGMLAAVAGVLAIGGLVRSTLNRAPSRFVSFISWGVFWLVISTNFLSDVPHPDSIQALHVLTVFWLCYTAFETKRFPWALAAMAVAGFGVFAKQTGAASVFGIMFVFGLLNPWGWRRWLLLAAFGGMMLGISLYLLWLPASARFFTMEVLAHQEVDPHKIVPLLKWLLARRRGVLVCLTLAAGFVLWRSGGQCRRYLICWAGLGFFSVAPNCMAYMKVEGTYNNLCLIEVWMAILVWPVVVMLPDIWSRHLAPMPETGRMTLKFRALPLLFQALAGLYVLALVPYKQIPLSEEYAHCRKVEAAVHQDLQLGRRILVSHGSMFLINAGVKKPPLDRVITSLEYLNAQQPELLSEMKARVASHYYGRIYLVGEYSPDVQNTISNNYVKEFVFSHVRRNPRPFFGLGSVAMPEFTVFMPPDSK